MHSIASFRWTAIVAATITSVVIVDAFVPPPTCAIASHASSSSHLLASDDDTAAFAAIPTSDHFSLVAVAGATGRTGRLVVAELLARNVGVRALVRDEAKASELLRNLPNAESLLEVRVTDLGSKNDVIDAVTGSGSGCDAAVWCATGFSDAPDQNIFEQVAAIFGFAVNKKKSIDAVGLPALGEALAGTPSKGVDGSVFPKVVMCSSAGVTRPSWSDEKKEALEGSAAIPIVRLNPFGILDVKAESEVQLRNAGVDYCIFRPCGLNDEWPSGARPVFSQGDVAVGRTNRRDVATILVDALTTPEATGKTFEAATIAGYAPAGSIRLALGRLVLDSANGGTGPSDEAVMATYALAQQLLPGEKQNAAKLAMGQTYEQLDRDEAGRLGNRGEERLSDAFPTAAAVGTTPE